MSPPFSNLSLTYSALRRPDIITTSQGRFAFQAPPPSASAESALSYGIENPIPPLPPPHLADQYFDLVYNHVQAQYSFLDWHALQAWHRDRDDICLNRPLVGSGQGTDHARGLAAFMLWLVYGYGARLMEERKIEGAVSHEVSPTSLWWTLLMLGLLLCSSRLLINFDISSLARHGSVSAAARNVFNLARTVRDQYMASGRTCTTYSHRAGATSSYAV
jgi:hypothetical protein